MTAGEREALAEKIKRLAREYRHCDEGKWPITAYQDLCAEVNKLAALSREALPVADPVAFRDPQTGECCAPPSFGTFTQPLYAAQAVAPLNAPSDSNANFNALQEHLSERPGEGFMLALNVQHPQCHAAAKAFWDYWEANGETHKRGYYESTWGAINRAIRLVGVVQHEWKKL